MEEINNALGVLIAIVFTVLAIVPTLGWIAALFLYPNDTGDKPAVLIFSFVMIAIMWGLLFGAVYPLL